MRKYNSIARQRGFTLVEILMVVIILGIAAAAIVPQLGTRDDLNVAAAARGLMGDLAYAQNRAIATQKKHYVEFSGSAYTLFARDTNASPLYALTHPVTNNSYNVTLGVSNTPTAGVGIGTINFDGTSDRAIQFDSLGAPSRYNPTTDTAAAFVAAGTITLQTSAGTFTASVSIDPSTGEASVN